MGNGDRIRVASDAWIPGTSNYKVSGPLNANNDMLVSDLIDHNTRKWKDNLIQVTFSMEDANKILRIPLVAKDHDDILVWRGKASGYFRVRSAYRILLESNINNNTNDAHVEIKCFYNKLRNLLIPAK